MDTDEHLAVADLTEEELLGRVFPLLPVGSSTVLGVGDDAAVLASPDGRVVVSTDVLVDGRHFRRDWSTGRHVGRRAATQNLADIAAMGARPTGLVVVLVAPADLAVSWVLDLARGLADVCAPLGVGVVGGDLSGGTELVVSVTVHGDLDGRAPVLRSGARPGDVLAHAGHLGWSAGGLALLTDDAPRSVAAGTERLLSAYREPQAPIGLGVTAAAAGATAMLDVSDGLLRDAGRLARASGVVLDMSAAGLGPAVSSLSPAAQVVGADPWEWVLTGGEDHGLLATFPPDAPIPPGFGQIGKVIGSVDAGSAERHDVLLDGAVPAVRSLGWDHFRR